MIAKSIVLGVICVCALLHSALAMNATCTISAMRANAIMQAAYNYVRANASQEQFSFVILDHRGVPKFSMRMDNAALATMDFATMKARTSYYLGYPSSFLVGYGNANYPGMPYFHLEHLSLQNTMSFLPGAVPLLYNNTQVCGSIGVSGSANPLVDEAAANFGAAAFANGQNSATVVVSSTNDPMLAEALTRTANAHDEAVRRNVQVGARIMDDMGRTVVLRLMDGASSVVDPGTESKGRSVWLFGVSASSSIAGYVQPVSPYFTFDELPLQPSPIAGAVRLLDAAQTFVGVVSISGAPSADTDAAIAAVGASGATSFVSNRLELTRALGAIDTALQYCANLNKAGSAVVIDRSGYPVALYRMDGASTGMTDMIIRKARSALAFGRDNQIMDSIVRPGVAFGLDLAWGGLVTYGGGSPLMLNGRLVGAIGVYMESSTIAEENGMSQAAATKFAQSFKVDIQNMVVPSKPSPGRIRFMSDVSSPLATMQAAASKFSATDRLAFAAYDSAGHLKLFVLPEQAPLGAGHLALASGRFAALYGGPSGGLNTLLSPTYNATTNEGLYYTADHANPGALPIVGALPVYDSDEMFRGSVGVSRGDFNANVETTNSETARNTFLSSLPATVKCASCPSCSSSSSDDKKKYTPGDMAGLAVGMILVTSLIWSGAVYFFVRKAKAAANSSAGFGDASYSRFNRA